MQLYYGEQQYLNMETVGFLPSTAKFGFCRSSRRESVFTHLYSTLTLNELKGIAKEKFYVVHPTQTNVWKTIDSWDDKPVYSFKGLEEHNFALSFFEHLYAPTFEDCVATSEEVCEFIDWTKSSGWPLNYLGLKTKADTVPYIAGRQFYDKSKTLPIWSCSGKEEYKDVDDINIDKIRVFQIPSFDLLSSQLKFGKRISLAIKSFLWSAYGFCPYYGGFDKLARNLLRKRFRGCYDVSGWDKFIPVLEDIYSILKKDCKIPDDDIEEFKWMCFHTCNYFMKLPDGRVVMKDYGNASGSGTTTRDNIFAHVIIFAAGLYAAYKKKNGIAPSLQKVSEQLVYLFGDDNVFSVDEDFSLICDFDFLKDHLSHYGLKLKFFFGGEDYPLEKLSFLGASFKERDGIWYPLYDVERLATSMVYEKNKLTLGQHISKIFTLMVMSYPSDSHGVFRDAYKSLINSELVLNSLDDPLLQSFHACGIPSEESIKGFFTGVEAEGKKSQLRQLFDFSVASETISGL